MFFCRVTMDSLLAWRVSYKSYECLCLLHVTFKCLALAKITPIKLLLVSSSCQIIGQQKGYGKKNGCVQQKLLACVASFISVACMQLHWNDERLQTTNN